MKRVTVTLLRKPDCHLCEVATDVVDAVVTDLAERGIDVDVFSRSILDDPTLEARFHDDVPVVLVNERFHTRWRVEPIALRQALVSAAT